MSDPRRFRYHNQCDRFRREAGGETDWQEMMSNAKPVSMRAFETVCNPEDMLDDGESLEEFVEGSADGSAGFYQSTIRNHQVLFLQTAGFEFIYTLSGGPIPKSPGVARACSVKSDSFEP